MLKKVLLVLLLLLPLSFAYRDYSFSMTVAVNPDGSAHITEKMVFFLENPVERTSFEYYLNQGKTTLADWQGFSKKIKYHLSGAILGLKITATREYATSFDAAAVTLEYDVVQLLKSERVGSRITKFTIDSSLVILSEGRGELILGNGMSLSLILPRDAYAVSLAPTPLSSNENKFSWEGPISGMWVLSYEREKSLSDEVSDFFIETSQNLQSSYVWIFVLLLLLAVGFKLVKPGEK